MRSLLMLSLLIPAAAGADFTATGDSQITGQLGIGTDIPRARVEAQISSTSQYGILVSSQNGSTLMSFDKSGKMSIGAFAPQAKLDIKGAGDNNDIGLQLRVGNSSSTTSSSQIVFVAGSTENYRHSIRTRSVDGQNLYNAVDFFLWNSTATPSTLGSAHVLSLQTIPFSSTGSVHVAPNGVPDVALEISNSSGTGLGTIHRASAMTPSSRNFKLDITYLPATLGQQAYAEVKALKHALFRYKSDNHMAPLRRGLIYEDAPESIRGEGNSVVVDSQVLNVEMALQEAHKRIEELEQKITTIESRRGGRR